MVKKSKTRKKLKSKPSIKTIGANKLRVGLGDLIGIKLDQKLLLWAFALILFVAITINFYMRSSETTVLPGTTTIPTTTIPTTTTMPTPEGTLIVALKDAEQKIPGGALLKSMNFTVIGVEVYSDGAAEWVGVLDAEKTLDLLNYTTTYAKIVEKQIETGNYSKIKLLLADGEVTLTHTLVGIYRPRTYGLNVQEETIVEHEFAIEEGDMLSLILDVDVFYSVLRTGEGYLMTPVITVTEEEGRAGNIEEI